MTDKRVFYDQIADEFDAVMNSYEVEKRLRLIFDTLLPEHLDGKRVLDMGCGTGIFTQRLAARGARVVTADIGPKLVALSRQRTPTALPAAASLESLAFAADTFDVIVCTEVIEHTPSPQRSVAELMRVLKPGGVLVLTVPNRVWHLSVKVADRLNIRPYHGLENWVWRADLLRWMRASGGEVETVIGFNLLPLFYKPLYGLLDAADRLRLLHPVMVNIGVRVTKQPPAPPATTRPYIPAG